MAAWKWIGFPGARADFTDWIDQAGQNISLRTGRHQRREGLMAEQKKRVDAVIIGYGWTGAIMAKTLTDAGLSVVALERGPARDTAPDFEYPRIIDELKYGVRGDLWQPLAKETVTVRHNLNDVAAPYRKYGSFVLGNGVGGAGVHWNGQLWRASPEDLRLRSHIEERYGKNFIPEDMTIQDYPVTFEELEPHFDHFEKVCGVSGVAGNLRGQIRPGGNPFEGRAKRRISNAAVAADLRCRSCSRRPRRSSATNPSRMPSANSSIAYTNPYGVRLGPCNLCGFCERFGCFLYSKASPQTTILPILADAAEPRGPDQRLRDANPARQHRKDGDRGSLHRRRRTGSRTAGRPRRA